MTAPTTSSPPLLQPAAMALITPDTAAAWLAEANFDNRTLRPGWVDTLAREITEGRWMMTGDPIRFDINNRLLDGQHRLHAIVRAGVAVWLTVQRGLAPEVRSVIDTGLPRSAGDLLAFEGIKNAVGAGSAARVAMSRRDGLLQFARARTRQKYSNSAILEFLRENPSLVDVVGTASVSARVIRPTSKSAWCYAMWVLETLNPIAKMEFESSLVESRTDGTGDARLALLRYFARDDSRQKTSLLYPPETIYVTFRAWNAWRHGDNVQRIQTMTGGTGPQGAVIPVPVA